ncbi:serine phosphatase RsbU (regulator of sigma subunit)/anti-sigma regulatory factor (Ser/Thr protein kinase) [Actinoplanes tereljensis]|uniref:PPM-type phosphatase domain-containing protein n=1 Tax=Paractinoplanes tereljensis TaxID=571912 RepID=A0A919NMQ2_9ACTN|nr:SpoIIE family protein phosphatase [Actinoplanes tereljensis]GIF21661.1 hypothetical protein Ate02nite_43910 [Actinoplanes tereljensis]
MPDPAANASDRRVGEPDVVRGIFESMPVMLVGLTGPEHRIDAVNAACRTVLGRDDFAGQTLLEVFPEMIGQQLYEIADRVYRSGTSQTAQGWRVQIEREPGSGRLDDVYVDFTVAPRLGPDGTVTGLNFVGVDATERVTEQQQARRESTEAVLRYEQARDVIIALQRRLLPPGLPVLPSVRIAGSYLLADDEHAAGGDWFDAVPLAGGRVALVVGDVVGHGVAASAAMGQLRAVLQDRLDETGDVVTAIRAADRMTRRVPGAHAATVCVVVVDPADGTLTYCSAGHPPPLVAGPEQARYLAPSGTGPLGTGADYAVATDRLALGEVVLLYSDGIIERPGRPPAEATVELSQVVADVVAGRGLDPAGRPAAERACTHTLELLVRQTGHTDDITLLAAQRSTPPSPLWMRLPGDTALVQAARDALVRWLRDAGAGPDDMIALAHAVVELVTNAAEHSHPDDADGTVTVTAELGECGEVLIRVVDDGHWRHRDRPGDGFRHDRGLGLAMATRLADHVEIESGEHGTTATVRHRLTRPAALLTSEQITHGLTPAPAPAERPELMVIVDQPHVDGSRVAIHGPLDGTSAQHLDGELNLITLGGTHELEVDLTGVTHLASVAVAVLHRMPGLRLYAPAGSVAQQIMSLVDLPHVTSWLPGP